MNPTSYSLILVLVLYVVVFAWLVNSYGVIWFGFDPNFILNSSSFPSFASFQSFNEIIVLWTKLGLAWIPEIWISIGLKEQHWEWPYRSPSLWLSLGRSLVGSKHLREIQKSYCSIRNMNSEESINLIWIQNCLESQRYECLSKVLAGG